LRERSFGWKIFARLFARGNLGDVGDVNYGIDRVLYIYSVGGEASANPEYGRYQPHCDYAV